MPLTETPVIALKRFVLECDRCAKVKTIEVTEADMQTWGQDDPPDALLPKGWQRVRRPDPVSLDDCENIWFDTRSCMSAWFGQFVRVLYGGPAELPQRRSSPRKKSKSKAGPVE
jgi:hypothetical protein